MFVQPFSKPEAALARRPVGFDNAIAPVGSTPKASFDRIEPVVETLSAVAIFHLRLGKVSSAHYSIRSERQLMEQLYYNLLYRWFVGLGVDDQVWVPTVFTKNRDRLLEVARRFLAELLALGRPFFRRWYGLGHR